MLSWGLWGFMMTKRPASLPKHNTYNGNALARIVRGNELNKAVAVLRFDALFIAVP